MCEEGWAPEDYRRDVGVGLGEIICREWSVNFMSVHQEMWLGWPRGCAEDRKVWTQTLIIEKQGICREGCWVGCCLLPHPTSSERKELDKA